MNSPVTSPSSLLAQNTHGIDKISAYYSLAFPNFTYYLQTLTVTIGRRPIPSSSSGPSSSSADVSSSFVDVDLGPLKSVSRLHARIEYEEEDERFVLVVLGRNGAWVDGIWAGSGSRVPLGARSQIQIATRTFHFILPPPPAQESSSLSSPPSTARQRSPSVDITSLSPSSSRPTSPVPKAAALESHFDNPQSSIPKSIKSSKKRKRPDIDQPSPENMPPKPPVTYAVMCYRAITSLGGKATLQDVVQWMMDNYEWYRLNAGGPWENSVRHNLSSNRAFRNAAKFSEERGKGFLWGLDPQYESNLRDQDSKARLAEQNQQQNHAATISAPASSQKAEPQVTHQLPLTREPLAKIPTGKKNAADLPAISTSEPFSGSATQTAPVATGASLPSNGFVSNSVNPPASSSTSNMPQIPRDVILPIVVGPLPDSLPASATAAALAASSSSSSSSTSAILTTPPIVLHSGTLILNPSIFSHLTPSQLKELEGLGAQKALEILQSYIVRFLKESKKLGRSKSRTQGRGRGRGRVLPKDGSREQDASADCENGVSTVAENQTKTAKLDQHEAKTSSIDDHSSLHPTSVNGGTEVVTDLEPARKKLKLDTVDDSVVEGNEVEIDVVGT